MLFGDRLVVVRGGGDLASGVVYQLRRAGFPVVVLELERPMAIRRAVSFATAIDEGSVVIEGVRAVRAASSTKAVRLAADGIVTALVSPSLPDFTPAPAIVVDRADQQVAASGRVGANVLGESNRKPCGNA